MRYRHVVLFFSFAMVAFATSAGAECLKAGADGQAVQGRLTIGRARDAAGRPERPYILQLFATACLDADDPEYAVKASRTIHVFAADDKLQPAFRRLVGKTVVVRGNPFSANTSHHHAPIVMGVSEISRP